MIDPESIEALTVKRIGFGIVILIAALLCVDCSGSLPTAPSSGFSWLTPSAPLPTTNPQFDQSFYNELAHGTFEFPGTSTPLHRLFQSPSVYMQRTGLSDAFVAQIEQTFRDELPAFTGNAIHLDRFESGPTLRADAEGWIVIELGEDDAKACGLTKLGAAAGHMWINTATRCFMRGQTTPPISVFAHEMGHALGFYHVASGLMEPYYSIDGPEQGLTDREAFHGAVAYTQSIGSR